MDSTILSQVGLSQGEAIIYTTLLKKGSSTVRDLAKEAGVHRTNIYDTLEKLKEKGLISFYTEGKTTHYKAADPSNLFNLLEEKKELLSTIIPSMKDQYNKKADKVEIEVFKGKEGMKAVFNDILKENKPYYAFGVRGQMREHLSVYAEQWLKKAKLQKLEYYGIYTKKDDLPSYYTEIRFLPKNLESPVSTYIYANKVNIAIWKPTMISINIKSEYVAKTYREHFNLLWEIAEKNK